MKILDCGYVELIDYMGSDNSIIEAARMSTDKGFVGWGPFSVCDKCGITVPPTGYQGPHTKVGGECDGTFNSKPGDEKLLKYLWEHKHYTPFEMVSLKLEIKAPIFVFREWHRHRTQSYNEMSARYIPLPDENYMPTITNLMERAEEARTSKNRQASSVVNLPLLIGDAHDWLLQLQGLYDEAELVYKQGIALGVPKEIARLPVPVARYSKMQASANLRNWLAFLTLRMDPAAQWEIRQYADAVARIVAMKFPRTWEIFKGEQP